MQPHPLHDVSKASCCLNVPFGTLAIYCSEDALTGIEFLDSTPLPKPPRHPFAEKVCEQLTAYLTDSSFSFSLPLKLDGTEHQNKVWQSLRTIPCGKLLTYSALSKQIYSSPRAVGQACGNNPIPIIIPCHRVVSKAGLGGFMHHTTGHALNIKRWLLAHEGAI